MFDNFSKDHPEVSIELLPPGESGKEHLSEGVLYEAHKSSKYKKSPLQVLPFYLEQHSQSGIGQLGILLIHIS